MTAPTETSIKPGDTVYVTKYALTVGITETTAHRNHVDDGVFVQVHWGRGWEVFPLRYVHLTEDAAQARVHEMCEAKLKSLRKQVAKVEAIATNGAKVKR
jgi:hypothetical protein